MALDILCMGEPMAELNQQPDGRFLLGHGGDTSNCAIAAAKQGAASGYLTAIGDDQFGRSFLTLWEQEGVDSSRVLVEQGKPTGIYFVTHDEDGHHFSYYRHGSAASLFGEDKLSEETFNGVRVLQASAISLAISEVARDAVFKAMRLAKDQGLEVAFDSNLRLNLWPLDVAREAIDQAMALSTIALPSIDDSQTLTGLENPDAIVDHYLAMGPTIVAMTMGPEGCLVATPDRRELIKGLRVESVDATAAGDCFDGSFLAEYLRTGDPFQAGRYANVAAALSTQGYGAIAPMPSRELVEAALLEV